MKQAIAEITQRLEQRLPDEHAFFTPAELVEAGLPDFLVARIRLTLRQQLSRSVAPPRVEWADAGVPEAEQAWRQFYSVLYKHTRLPRKRASQILENAVSDVLRLLCEPREFLPRYLFAGDAVLSIKEARERVEWVVVYPQLGQFLPKYMQARNLEVISRARYENALRQLDDKLVSRHQPGDWLNLLSPLFVLFEGKVPARLLQRFFEDKARYGIAGRLQEQDEPEISQGLLLSFLSPGAASGEASPQESGAATPSEPAKPSVPGPAPKPAVPETLPEEAEESAKQVPVPETPDEHFASEEASPEKVSSTASGPEAEPPAPRPEEHAGQPPQSEKEEIQQEPSRTEPDETDVKSSEEKEEAAGSSEDALAAFLSFEFKSSDELASSPEDEEQKSASPSVSAANTSPDKAETEDLSPASDPGKSPGTGREIDAEEDEAPLYSRFTRSENEKDEPAPEQDSKEEAAGEEKSREEQRRSKRQQIPPIAPPPDSGAEEDLPLWKRLAMQQQPSEEPVPEAAEPDEPEAPPGNEANGLPHFLADNEAEYIKHLFNEDRAAYNEALARLSNFQNWREAGKFITNEIFRKRKINMYGKWAVAFTDQLHKYFLTRRMKR